MRIAVDARRFERDPRRANSSADSRFRCPSAGGAALARLRRVPAGDYRDRREAAPPEGKLAVVVGRNDPPLESAPAGCAVHAAGYQCRVMSLSVRADTDGARRRAGMRIKPVRIWHWPHGSGRPAVRATRYGSARVFFFDEQAYLEPRILDASGRRRHWWSSTPMTMSHRTGRADRILCRRCRDDDWPLDWQFASQSYSLSPRRAAHLHAAAVLRTAAGRCRFIRARAFDRFAPNPAALTCVRSRRGSRSRNIVRAA